MKKKRKRTSASSSQRTHKRTTKSIPELSFAQQLEAQRERHLLSPPTEIQPVATKTNKRLLPNHYYDTTLQKQMHISFQKKTCTQIKPPSQPKLNILRSLILSRITGHSSKIRLHSGYRALDQLRERKQHKDILLMEIAKHLA